MATKKNKKQEAVVPVESDAEIETELGAMGVVAGVEDIHTAQAVAAAAAGDLAAGASDLTRARDVTVVAERMSDLSGVVAAAGVTDVAQGAELLAKSEDVAALSALVGLMGEDDLERGLELARLAGELEAVGNVVTRLQMPVLAKFLAKRSASLQGVATDTIVRAAVPCPR
jgi:hypothetical protein